MSDHANIKDTKNVFRSARISLGDGWKGSVSLTFPGGVQISADDWTDALQNLDLLLSNPMIQLKADGNTVVAVYDLAIGGKTLAVAIKTHNCSSGMRNFARTLLRNKSARNFRTAAKLCKNGIPTAYPLAALTQKRGLITAKTIFITEYIDSSCNLYYFLSDNVSQNDLSDKASVLVKRQAGSQIAHIFAGMYSIGLSHRDAKAGNFLVAPKGNGKFEIMLVDMDGIKSYLPMTAKRRFFPFTKLGSVLVWYRGINLSDYLRSFRIYCTLTGIDKLKSDKVFRRVSRSAIALRLLTFAVSAIKK